MCRGSVPTLHETKPGLVVSFQGEVVVCSFPINTAWRNALESCEGDRFTVSSAAAAKDRGQRPQTKGQKSEISGQTSAGSVPSTLAALCLEAIARHNKPDAVSEKRGDEWVRISAAE